MRGTPKRGIRWPWEVGAKHTVRWGWPPGRVIFWQTPICQVDLDNLGPNLKKLFGGKKEDGASVRRKREAVGV